MISAFSAALSPAAEMIAPAWIKENMTIPAEAIQTYINSLKGLDAEGLAGVALYCSYTRLAELRHIFVHAPPETFRKFVWLYYDPILLESAFVEAALGKFEQSLARIERAATLCI